MSILAEQVTAKRKKEKAEQEKAAVEYAASQKKKERQEKKKQKELLDLLMTELDGQFGFTVIPTTTPTIWGTVASIKHKHETYVAISREVSHTYRPCDECGEETYKTDAFFISTIVNPSRRDDYLVYEEEGLMATTNTGKTHKERFLESLIEWVHERTKWDR